MHARHQIAAALAALTVAAGAQRPPEGHRHGGPPVGDNPRVGLPPSARRPGLPQGMLAPMRGWRGPVAPGPMAQMHPQLRGPMSGPPMWRRRGFGGAAPWRQSNRMAFRGPGSMQPDGPMRPRPWLRGPAERPAGGPPADPVLLFRMLDLNDDGVVERDELEQLVRRLREQDRNRDGRLVLEEWAGPVPHAGPPREPRRRPQAEPPPHGGPPPGDEAAHPARRPDPCRECDRCEGPRPPRRDPHGKARDRSERKGVRPPRRGRPA